MKMIPAFKDYIWGGERLVKEYNKKTLLRPVAESWEISCHPDGPSKIANGIFAGRTLADVLSETPSFAGTRFMDKSFPVLIKFIDAKLDLSVQVHPGDEYAWRHENQPGKNECWYVMAAGHEARLLLGCRDRLPREELLSHITNDTLVDQMNTVLVQPGDFFEIPAGLLHAIGTGCLIAEVQQSSNVTYRVYDYGRLDSSGKPREFHIDKALDVTDTSIKVSVHQTNASVETEGCKNTNLTDWQYFSTDLLEVTSHANFISGKAEFQCIVVLSGELSVLHGDTILELNPCESVFIPAGIGAWSLKGTGKLLKITP